MDLAAGTIGGLLPKLHDLSKDNHILPRRVRQKIMVLIAKLENIQSALSSRMSEAEQRDDQVNLWTNDASRLFNHIDGLITEFNSSVQDSASPGSRPGHIITRIELMLTAANARRKFAQEIRNANGQVNEFVDRHGRYRIDDSGFFPFRPPRSPDPDVNEQRDLDMGKEMASEEELDALLAHADHVYNYKLPSRVKQDIEFLKAEVQIVAVVLQKIAKLPAGELDEVTEAWADGMRDVSRNIKRAVEDSKVPELGGKGTNLTTTSMKARRQFASKIRDLKRCLLEVADRRQRYYLRGLRVPKLNSGTNDFQESLVAIEGHRDFLVNLLMDEGTTSNKQQLKVASIVGVAGVGKTTLAKVVYSRLAESFDCSAWVSLPTLGGINGVLHDLLAQIEVRMGEHPAPETLGAALVVMDEKALIDKICQILKDKRYFIVIDGLWDLTSWNTLKQALIGKGNGSAVLTTSRRDDIEEDVGGIYRLGPLTKSDSIRLFYKTLFRTEDKCPTGLSEKMEILIEKCGGIPATIISTAVSLAGNPWKLKEWYEVHDSAFHQVDEQGPDGIIRILLDKSYSELPFHLKCCLLYLSLFRKGYEVSTEKLVWQWIAEGFIQESNGKNLQEVGESYLKELIKRKFLKSVQVDVEGKALSCRVYDLVYDLIVTKSSELNFVKVADGGTGRILTDGVQRLSIQGNSSDQPTSKLSSSDLRTLMVYSDANLMPPLSSFRQLRVLDLGGCDSLKNDHLKGIGNFFLLKYLAIGGSCITGLPKEIGKLNLLQTLDLRLSGLKELPESVALLRQLERLCFNSYMMLPAWIGKMEGLKELGDINISKPELLKELLKLAKLKILRIAIWTCDESCNVALLEYLNSLVPQAPEPATEKQKRLPPKIESVLVPEKNQNIQSLSVLTCCPLDFMNKLDKKWNPPGLQKLEIRESSFLTLPTWVGSLHNLFSLTIEVHKLSQQMVNILGELQNLCTLSLTSKRPLEGKFGIVPDGFKNLTSFKFVSSAMGQLFASEPKAMQMLKTLQLSFKALQTKDINTDFRFGMEDLCSLEHVRVEIICFNASCQLVGNAEAAIRDAISRGRSRCPNLEITRVREGDMIKGEEKEGEGKESKEKDVVSSLKEEQQKQTNNEKSSSWKIRVISKKFRQKKRRVTKNYRILSLNIKSHMLTLQAL